jgi:hypothetical protein
MKVYYRGEATAFAELKKQPPESLCPLPPRSRPVVVRKAKKDHPWRQPYQTMRTQLQGFVSVRIPATTSTTKRGYF